MKETTIALESAGADLAEWIGRARRERTTIVVLDDNTPVARLVPTLESRCTGAELARALESAPLSADEAHAWANDLRLSRAGLSAPEDKWR